MKTLSPRTRTLIYVGIALLALLLLAGSLSDLVFDPGLPLPLRNMAPDLYDETIPEEWGRLLLAAFRVLLIFAWLLLPVYVIYLLISKEARKRFLRDLMTILPILLLLMLLGRSQFGERVVEDFNMGEGGPLEFGDLSGTPPPPLPEFQPPPAWVTTLTVVLLAGAVTLFVAGIGYALWRRAQRSHEPLRVVQREAQEAINAIEAGGDVRDAILRAYVQMVQAVAEYRNIRRGADVTPHEFEAYLQSRGLPVAPVHDLTQLFEQVRYGAYRPARQDERAAVASLAAIVSACERMRER